MNSGLVSRRRKTLRLMGSLWMFQSRMNSGLVSRNETKYIGASAMACFNPA